MKKELICLTGFGDYRKGVLIELYKQNKNIIIISGDRAFDSSVKLVSPSDFSDMKFINNIFLFRNKFLFQFGANIQCLFADKLILDLNPRVVNVWFLIIFRLMLFKRTITWGHAWPRNTQAGKGILRFILRKLSKAVIVYTETQKNEILLRSPSEKIIAAPNSLYSKYEILNNKKRVVSNPINIIYVGRLVKEKKPMLLLQAFINVKDKLDVNAKLLFIGNGDQITELKSYVKSKGFSQFVEFLGHITDAEKLAEYYTSSYVSVSSGYVGLSITQSFSFGVPMIISDKEPHSPEIEAAKLGYNCDFFDANSVSSLSKKMLDFYENREYWLHQRDVIINDCAINYSTEVMANRILSSFNM